MAVELFDPFKKYAAPAGAHLVYNGGPLMDDAKLVGVFFDELGGGAYALRAQMDGFLRWIGGSDIFTEEGEYNTGGFVLAPGSYLGAFDLSLSGSTPPPPPPPGQSPCVQCLEGCISGPCANAASVHLEKAKNKHRQAALAAAGTVLQDSDVQTLLTNAITSGAVPAPDANTLYVMFFPTGVVVQMGSDASCQTFCGYHSDFADGRMDVKYAVLPFPDCAGCTAGLAPFDALTAITTHEIAEAITDPDPGSGWYDQNNGEVGDICAWQFRHDGQYNVQLLWSNHKNACV